MVSVEKLLYGAIHISDINHNKCFGKKVAHNYITATSMKYITPMRPIREILSYSLIYTESSL